MKRGTLDRQRQALTRGHTLRSRFPEERRNARAGACAPAHCEPRVGGGGGGGSGGWQLWSVGCTG